MTPTAGDAVPAALADAVVRDAGGNDCALGTLWSGRPAVLVFLRHFGCVACTEHVTLLAPRLHEFTRLGVAVVYVGNGEPNFIAGFVERNFIDTAKVRVVTDASLAAHAAAGMHRSLMATFGPRGVFGLARAFVALGFRQSGIEGDNYQQGGVLVLDARGHIVYAYADRAAGDHAPMEDVIEAGIRAAAADVAVV